MSVTFNLTGGLDSLQEHLTERIRHEESRAESASRLRDKRHHRSYASGLREALEYLDAAIRSAAPEETKVPVPVELRRAGAIMTEIEDRATDRRNAAAREADQRAAETFGALA